MPNSHKNLPEGWIEVKLGSIGEAIIGLTYSPKDVKNKGILVLRSSNVKDSNIVNADNVYVDLNINDKIKTKLGDILICARNGSRSLIGKNAMITKEFTNQTFGAFMTVYRSKYNNILQYFFKTDLFQKQVEQNLGPTINQITSGNFNNFKVLLPESLKEQERIVEVLESWDNMISALEKKDEKLSTYKKALMQKLLTPQPHWEENKLGDTFNKINKKNIELHTNVLTISGKKGLINQENYFNKNVSATNLKGYYLLKRGDFAYNKSYSKGYPMGAIKRLNNYDKGVVSTLYIPFINNKSIDSNFAEHYFESGSLNNEIYKIAQEGARNHGLLNVSVSDFFNAKIHIPPLPEQEEIANALSKVDEYIELNSKQLANYRQQKKALMQKLLTGEWRV